MIEKIYRNYRISLYRFALYLTCDQQMSQDLVSDTFLAALKNRDLLATLPDQKLKSWLFRVLKNSFLDEKRKKTALPLDQCPEPAVCPDLDKAIDCRNLLNSLNQEKKLLLTLKFLHEMSSTEISRHLERPASTVRRQIAEALKTLQEKNGIITD